MTIKEVCLNILVYVGGGLLLLYAAKESWEDGNKFIAILSALVGLIMIWQAIDNAKESNNLNA